MKTRTIFSGLMLLPLICAIGLPARSQTAKPAAPSHQQTADAAARKQLAAYLADFKNNPDDATLRDQIIELAKTLKPAPVVPLPARSDFAKAAAQMKAASSADDFKAAAQLFEQVAAQAPWYADAYLNAASAYAKAADYDSAKRNLALYMAAVRPGVDTQKAEDLQSDMEQQKAAQQQQQALQQFQQALQQFRANPSDAARQQIIKLAQAMKTPPAIPEEAREHYMMATTFAANAKSDTEKAKDDSGLKQAAAEFANAIQEYKAALLTAPWWADAYEKLALAQKAADQYDDAIASLNLYLLFQPADARDAQDEIYKLKADKKTAADQKAAEERRKWEEENSPQAIAAREQKKQEDLLRSLDGKHFLCGHYAAVDVQGGKLLFKKAYDDGSWRTELEMTLNGSEASLSGNCIYAPGAMRVGYMYRAKVSDDGNSINLRGCAGVCGLVCTYQLRSDYCDERCEDGSRPNQNYFYCPNQ
ncbi:MAG: hypothetical protein ABSA48_13040 [Terracidiphilus sp.]|jgi:hypothetical protein